MNAMIRGELQAASSASNPDADDDAADGADAADGEPAQSRDAKPASGQPGRRYKTFRCEEAFVDSLYVRIKIRLEPSPIL
jgi:hypothetical protein